MNRQTQPLGLDGALAVVKLAAPAVAEVPSLDGVDVDRPDARPGEVDFACLTECQARRVRATLAGQSLAEIAAAEGVTYATAIDAIDRAAERFPAIRRALELAGVTRPAASEGCVK